MKNLLTALLMILFGTIIISSCTKTNLTNPAQTSQNLNSNTVTPDVPYCGTGYQWDFYLGKCVPVCPTGYHNDSITGACVVNVQGKIIVINNPNNPDDNEGSQHNNAVNSIFPTIDPSSNNLDSVVLSKDISYLSTLGYNADSIQNYYNQEVQKGYLPFSELEELDSLGNILYSQGLLSSYGNNYVQQIYGYANQYLNTDTITTAKYNSFANNLVSLETTIQNDSRIPSWEKQVLLSSCSIGRYSGAYWGNYILSQSSGGVSSMSTFSLWTKMKNWMRFVIADVGGGITAVSSGIHSFWMIFGISVGTSVVTAATFTAPQN
jgi:hypothetical protein